MTKILVFSDSHGRTDEMLAAIKKDKPDMVLHLGDYVSDCEELVKAFPGLDIRNVRGNCDINSARPLLLLFEVEGKRIFACHGHSYRVKSGYTDIALAGLEADADIVLFGHTHIAFRDNWLKTDLMNPGSIGKSGAPSYGEIIIDNNECSLNIIRI